MIGCLRIKKNNCPLIYSSVGASGAGIIPDQLVFDRDVDAVNLSDAVDKYHFFQCRFLIGRSGAGM
ncbi:MAG: hypothetical protein K0Q67_2728 [Cellvibrio sp.]|jgi:hypothetical protein|nr:hypothetical protein [Cellvibrio sp.]